jgi:murein DD-endopeptidase MepM/ murein hydrolase activator NlpD
LTGGFIYPAPGYGITSSFGYRTHPIHGDRRLHSGTDFGTPTGTIIRAVDGGQVTFAGISGSLTSGYGRLVIVNHGNGVETYYAHLQGFFVQATDRIALGDPVGRANSSGWSTGPHLHFEVRQNGQPQNPMNYLS